MSNTTIYAADLFAGAGGASLGLARACNDLGYELDLVAVNHWPQAVETHMANFPTHVHHCKGVEAVDPLEAVPSGYLDILLAGPECTHFSRARGGKPKNKQSRTTPYDIMHWLEVLYVQTVIIENVREFLDWGPLDNSGKAIQEFKGRDFRLFVGGLEELGYTVRWRLLKACDYGDPTSRERLFIQATRGGEAHWPQPSHCNPKHAHAFPDRKPWRNARENVIDWSLKGISIYRRAEYGLPELADNTKRRIYTGVHKYAGLPFLVQMANSTEGHERRCFTPDRPLTTVTAGWNGHGIVEPLLIVFRNHCDGASVEKPLGTVCTSPGHFGLIEPALCEFLTAAKGERDKQAPRTHSVDVPMPTVVAQGRPGDLAQAILYYGYNHGNGQPHPGKPISDPLPTVTATWDHIGLIEPVPSFLVRYNGGANRSQSVESPLTTLDTSNRLALCQFVVEYHGNGRCLSLADPLGTVTANDRFGLVELQIVGEENGQTLAEGRIVGWLDILFRMLQPHELAAAQGFPRDYHFTGTREEVVAQIGNAWPGDTATALCMAALARPRALHRPVPDFSPLHQQTHRGLRRRLLTASKDFAVASDLFTLSIGATS